MSRKSKAVRMFQEGSTCSQAIAATYGEPFGLTHVHAMNIASGFAAGMQQGETCGTVTGAIMVLGLAFASEHSETKAGRQAVYEKVLAFSDRFENRNGSLICREILGCDIRTPEGMARATSENLFKTRCVKAIEDAADILEELLA